MAMTERGDNVDHNNTPQSITDRVYEEFKPKSEWRKGDRQDTLLVYLPGFEEEHIKVTTEGLNRVRVRGERFIAGNKWSRFKEDYRVPENYEMRGVRSNFGTGGVLTITMPKTEKALRSDLLQRIGREAFSIIDESTANRPRTNDYYWWPKVPKPGGRYEWRNVPGRSYILQVPRLENTTQSKVQSTTYLLDKQLFQRMFHSNEQPFRRKKHEESLLSLTELAKKKKPQTSPYTLPPQPKPMSSSTTTKQEPFKRAPEAEPVHNKEIQNVFEKPSVGEKSELDPKRSLEKHNVLKKPSVGEKTDLAQKRSCMPVVKAGVGIGLLLIVAVGVHVSCTCKGK